MKNLYLSTALLFLVSYYSFTQIIHVPGDYASIQQAANAAVTGDTILIDNGTYQENPQITKALTIASNFIFSGDPMDIENTIVDGMQMGSVFLVTDIQNDTVQFTGLTVTNGNGTLCDPQGTGIEQLHGGGFYIKDVEVIIIDNMLIKENQILTDHNSAGGIFCQSSSLWIKNSKVVDNLIQGGSFFGEGAGLYVYESEARIVECEVTGNSSFVAYGEGGGLYAKNAALEIINSSFTNNECIDGGAMHLVDSDAEIHGCTIENNLAWSTGAINYMDFTEDHSFLLTNSTINQNNGTNGLGAIKLYSANVDIFNCQVNYNVGGQSGGAFNCSLSEVNIYHSEVNHNEASTGIGADGGGMILYLSTVYLNNVELKNNILSPPNSFNRGGAIVMSQTNLLMDSVVISGNVADQGGAIYSGNASFIRMNHTLISGHNAQKGGAIYSWGSNFEIISSTIADNSAPTGGGIHSLYDEFIFVNSILWDNTPTEFFFNSQSPGDTTYVDFAFSDVRGHESNFSNLNNADIVWWDGNVDTNPQFVDAPGGDYNLINESPLVDAGTAYFELNGIPIVNYSPGEYVGTAPDMGAYENQSSTIFVDEIDEKTLKLFPNPASEVVNISMVNNMSSLQVYDYTGNLVAEQHAGGNSCSIKTSHLSPGVYLFRVMSEGGVVTRQVVVK